MSEELIEGWFKVECTQQDRESRKSPSLVNQGLLCCFGEKVESSLPSYDQFWVYITEFRLLLPEFENIAKGTERSIETVPIASTVVLHCCGVSWLHNLIESHTTDRMLYDAHLFLYAR